MVADVLLTSRRHWKQLEPEERDRLIELARKSGGRPKKNLSPRERREAAELVEKFGHIEFVGDVAGIVLPFRPLSRLATWMAVRRLRRNGPKQLEPGPDQSAAG
jgi:hypothetical protein